MELLGLLLLLTRVMVAVQFPTGLLFMDDVIPDGFNLQCHVVEHLLCAAGTRADADGDAVGRGWKHGLPGQEVVSGRLGRNVVDVHIEQRSQEIRRVQLRDGLCEGELLLGGEGVRVLNLNSIINQ